MIDVKKLIIKQQIQISCFKISYHTTSFIGSMDKKHNIIYSCTTKYSRYIESP